MTLTRIVLHRAEGVALVAGGVRKDSGDIDVQTTRPGPHMKGVQIVSGEGRYAKDARIRFAVSCKDRVRPEIVLRLRRTEAGRGSMAGFAVVYSESGKERSVYYEAEITLCPRADNAPPCDVV